jgi:ribonuclease P protein component
VERLKRWSDFRAVMSAGFAAKTPHFVLHQWSQGTKVPTGSGLEESQTLFANESLILGALTPKRWAKRAVTRNLIRRQIHAVSQEFVSNLKPTAYVVRLRATFDVQKFASASSDTLKKAVREELTQLFGKVGNT